ncbi:MAG: WYL domain-containing protein [Planctomycetota bacterium]|nr:MAG: WYL domain-containing protein [Planctomycetota bacterium]
MSDRSHAQYQDGRKPPKRVPKSERILNLIALLLRADQPLPVTEILGKVTGYDDAASRESLMRRFERDKAVLRKIGIPIEHTPATAFGQEGYYIPRKDYFLREFSLPPSSGQILNALFAWVHSDGGTLSDDLRSALVKVGYLVDVDAAAAQQAPERPREALSPSPGEGRPPEVHANLQTLSEAVLRHKRVRFRYYSLSSGSEAVRTVEPYGLGFSWDLSWNASAWYVVGRDCDKEVVRVFKVGRIRDRAVFTQPGDDSDFEPPEGFRVREYLGRAQWEYEELGEAFSGGDEARPMRAEVGFPPAVASEVRSLVSSAQALEVRDGLEVLEFRVQQRRPFLRFLLRYAPRVRVFEPPELREGLRELAREVLSRYEDAS